MAGFFSTYLKTRKELSANQQLTRAELKAVQLEKFRKLASHANQHSAYYQRVISKNNIDVANCTPDQFPVLTKPLLMQHFDDIVTDRRISKEGISKFLSHSTDPNELLFDQFHIVHTSGSSGQIGYFVFSEADWGRGMAQGPRVERQSNTKIGFQRPRMAYFGAIGGHFGGVSMMSTSQRGILKWLMKLSLNEVNDPLPKVIAHLNEFQPHVVVGYTTALKILAEKQLSGELNISPVAVSTGGEAQTDRDRELFSRAFNCVISNAYGCSEHLMMGYSRPDGKTMELYDDNLIYEIYDDHSIITNLFNFTLPLIRYRMTDIFRLVEDDNSADPYLLIHSLVGRSEIVPKFENRDGIEDFISAFTIIELFIPGVNRFQMRLKSKTSFQFAICPSIDQDESARSAAICATQQRLVEVLSQKHMENVSFDVLVVDDLPVNKKTGKFQLIVDES